MQKIFDRKYEDKVGQSSERENVFFSREKDFLFSGSRGRQRKEEEEEEN